jgi:hypothetical protein
MITILSAGQLQAAGWFEDSRVVLTNWSDRGSVKPRVSQRFERDDVIREPTCGHHRDQQPLGAARTGRTHGCTTNVHPCTKTLAPQGPSTHGPPTTALWPIDVGAGAVHDITSAVTRTSTSWPLSRGSEQTPELAPAFHKNKTLNGGIALHGIHPRSTPKRTNLSTGRLLRRRAQHNAGAPVTGFVTALHT